MRILFFEHIGTALHSLKMNRVRSFLTMLGVAIGVASITTIISLSAGATKIVNDQIKAVDDGVIVVAPGAEKSATVESLLSPANTQQYSVSTLTQEDVKKIDDISEDVYAAPIMSISLALKNNDTVVESVQVVATTSSFVKTTPLAMQEGGEFLKETATGSAAVLGSQTALDLFGTQNPIGRIFKIRSQTFTVIGVLEREDVPLNYSAIDYNNAVFVDMKAGVSLGQGAAQIQQINVFVQDKEQLKSTSEKIVSTVEELHGERDFTVKTGKEVTTPSNRTFYVLTAVMTAIAGISLVVGGVGIMNIMLVNVAERTREIGIRKAVGASSGSIATQFIVEALIVSIIGGLLGYLAGIGVAFFVGTLLYFTPVYTWQVAIAAVGVSMVIGLVFGIYPAVRAARKDPIESLRQYR